VSSQFVLVPSPLTGPTVWAPVSRALRSLGVSATVAELEERPGDPTPFWVQHANSVARLLACVTVQEKVILAGHSGAGPLLPAVGAFSPHPVGGYIFVDAGLPIPGESWLQELDSSLPEFAAEVRDHLEAGGRFPEWTEEDLRDVVPDEGLRRGFVAELRPRPLSFFTEQFPTFSAWPDAPCGYVRFSEGYEGPAARARSLGWECRELPGGHFHMVVDPDAVATALLDLSNTW
jgi:pimeloyl-ACP methyl ester carboxylesterase